MRAIDLPAHQTAAFVLQFIAGPRMRILDVGCGNGLVAQRLQDQGHTVVAIDESPDAVQAARELGVTAMLANWPSFEDAPFDIVLFAASLHHIQPLEEAIEHARRMLVPSGRVVVEDFAWEEIDPATAEWFYGIVRILAASKLVEGHEKSFAAELARSGGDYSFWKESHGHELHSVQEMFTSLRTQFHPMNESVVAYLYRYLCPVLPQNDTGYAITTRVLEMEKRLAESGAISLIGHRFVGSPRF
jgi:SAM-dependent methyltransferase